MGRKFLEFQPPAFRSHLLIRGGHAQTLMGNLLPGTSYPYRAELHRIAVSHGDQIVIHDDRPPHWGPRDPVTLLVHGLGGSHDRGYMVRTAGKLNAVGVRTFRIDLRGTGAGATLAKRPYHPGLTEDIRAAVERIAAICPGSPLHLAGFSLGGNLVLKTLGEFANQLPAEIVQCVTINPAIDLPVCSASLGSSQCRVYDRHFVRFLTGQVRQAIHLEGVEFFDDPDRAPRSVEELEDRFTRTVWGYQSMAEYHEESSALPWLDKIRVPALIIAADDDPLVPLEIFERLPATRHVQLLVTRGGGHLGFFGRGRVDPDRRWAEWRIVDRIAALHPHLKRQAA